MDKLPKRQKIIGVATFVGFSILVVAYCFKQDQVLLSFIEIVSMCLTAGSFTIVLWGFATLYEASEQSKKDIRNQVFRMMIVNTVAKVDELIIHIQGGNHVLAQVRAKDVRGMMDSLSATNDDINLNSHIETFKKKIDLLEGDISEDKELQSIISKHIKPLKQVRSRLNETAEKIKYR